MIFLQDLGKEIYSYQLSFNAEILDGFMNYNKNRFLQMASVAKMAFQLVQMLKAKKCLSLFLKLEYFGSALLLIHNLNHNANLL